jgi:cytochrome oxidase Cu insertion factor (SCO1/SenC/PrrC family)
VKIKTILNIGVASTFAVVVAAVLLIVLRGKVGQAGGSRLPILGEAADFSLTEAGGSGLQRSDLRGKVWIASFIFTRCAEACPMMMRKEVKLQAELPVRDDLRLVSFSVDPDWDTPQVLTEYARTFGADRSRWLFLTGDKQQIYRLAREGFRLGTLEADPSKEMPILHSSQLVLVDRNGLIRGYYDCTDDVALQKLPRDVERVLAEKS